MKNEKYLIPVAANIFVIVVRENATLAKGFGVAMPIGAPKVGFPEGFRKFTVYFYFWI